MKNIVVIGAQWGDEGKGKVVDILAPHFDIVARYQGGHNAGHTVRIGERKFILRLIPSGILHSECECVIGNGTVVNPEAFNSELQELREMGIELRRPIVRFQPRSSDTALSQRARPRARRTVRPKQCRHDDARNRPGLRRQSCASRDSRGRSALSRSSAR